MLLPDNIHPKNSIFFNGAIVLDLIQEHNAINIVHLYSLAKQKVNISYSIFVLCLDWLFLIDQANLNEEGDIILCS